MVTTSGAWLYGLWLKKPCASSRVPMELFLAARLGMSRVITLPPTCFVSSCSTWCPALLLSIVLRTVNNILPAEVLVLVSN